MKPQPNYSTKQGALELANNIQRYWLKQGKAVQIRIEIAAVEGRESYYCVRSDMSCGFPKPKEASCDGK
jgi:hypothetical protein